MLVRPHQAGRDQSPALTRVLLLIEGLWACPWGYPDDPEHGRVRRTWPHRVCPRGCSPCSWGPSRPRASTVGRCSVPLSSWLDLVGDACAWSSCCCSSCSSCAPLLLPGVRSGSAPRKPIDQLLRLGGPRLGYLYSSVDFTLRGIFCCRGQLPSPARSLLLAPGSPCRRGK